MTTIEITTTQLEVVATVEIIVTTIEVAETEAIVIISTKIEIKNIRINCRILMT